jgi:hypothetical protein
LQGFVCITSREYIHLGLAGSSCSSVLGPYPMYIVLVSLLSKI